MSTKKKGMLTVSGEWARHLRPWGRRQFWSAERMVAQQTVWSEARDELRASANDAANNSEIDNTGNNSLQAVFLTGCGPNSNVELAGECGDY